MADRIVVMNHGVIEQVGAPAEIYREPASVFVADFIGTMNFLAAEVGGGAAPDDGGIRAGGLALACDTSGYSDGDRITAAIRPEDITLVDPGNAREDGGAMATGNADADGGFDATVEYVEFLGSFARVELSTAGERLLIDLPITQLQRLRSHGREAPCGRWCLPTPCASTPGRRPMAEAVLRALDPPDG